MNQTIPELLKILEDNDKSIIETHGWDVMQKVQILREGIALGYIKCQ